MLKQFLDGISWPFRRLDRAVERDIEEKTQAAVRAGLVVLQQTAPALGELLAGRQIQVEVSIRLVPPERSP